MIMGKKYSTIVVGSGNAGLCAAISAAESLPAGSKVLLIDKCAESYAGGNGWYTPGLMRARHNGLNDLLTLVITENLDISSVSIDPYTAEDFHTDLNRTSSGRYDREVGEALVEHSTSVLRWMAQHGVQFQLTVDPAAPIGPDGKRKFPPATCITAVNGGRGLISNLLAACARLGVEVWYRTSAKQIVLDDSGAFQSLVVEKLPPDDPTEKRARVTEEIVEAHTVILAAGGYEASPRLLTKHHGPGFASAAVRGTPYNNGEVLEMVLNPPISAKRTGDWDAIHCSVWDADAPLAGGDRTRLAGYVKCDFALGITLNIKGQRFFDEGLDSKAKIYAIFARAITEQPGGIAFQVWDAKAAGKLNPKEYGGLSEEGRIRGATIRDLAQNCAKMGLEDVEEFVKTVEEYNAACHRNTKDSTGSKECDFGQKDGLATDKALVVPKSNWAIPLDEGPFEAYRVRCGITFTFGGVAIDPETAGLRSGQTGKSVPGVFCCGEMVGGLFYGSQANGSGLTAGALFGRVAGMSAAGYIRTHKE